ncbi:MAG: malonic semialdehyde reductase [Pedobacter sp.]|nr:malonic semialdehyde reductase [Pedobacter sp.]
MNTALNDAALKQLFTEARTHNGWLDKPVSDELLKQLYQLTVMGPTAANSQPLRVVFVKSAEAKARLKPHLSAGNLDKTMSAPVTAIIASDYAFYEQLPTLFPHADAKSWFVGNQPLIDTSAFRNGSLQGGYFILAARALGLDTGPMSGFDNAGVDKEFFAGTAIKSNFLVNLGYGDVAKLFPRSPRPDFADFAKIL